MRDVLGLLKASANASQQVSVWTLMLSGVVSGMVSIAACGSEDPIVGEPPPERSETTDPVGKPDAGTSSGKRDASTVKDPPAGDPGNKKDAAVAAEPDNCGRSGFTTGAVTPDMLIVLDRSGSMKPGGFRPGLRCDNISPIDILTFGECVAANVDCTRPADQMTTFCGGTQVKGPIDRWTPSVAAVTTLTKQFDQDVAFGLMTFPASSNECGPGDLKVPIDVGNAAEIATVLQDTQPGGGTPTGESLQAALKLFHESPAAADSVAPLRYVLLVTDGQPTCPNSNGGSGRGDRLEQDKKFTLDALDALRDEGIKTFVVGYDAALDPALAGSLTEFAQHGGTDNYYPVQDEQSLVGAFKTISETIITCAFEFKAEVKDPRLVHVTLDKKDLLPDTPDGWTIEGKTITVQGASCALLQEGKGHVVEIVMECEPYVYL